MENSEIIEALELTAKLMEIHDENPFKVRGYSSAVYNLEKITVPLATLSPDELEKLDGVGKSMATKITEMSQTGTFKELREFIEKTPPGLLDILEVKGLGPKKIRSLWKEHNITDITQLYEACISNKLTGMKGFGEKTQLQVKENIEFIFANKSKRRIDVAETLANGIYKLLSESGLCSKVSIAGEVRRRMETVDKVLIMAATDNYVSVMSFLDKQSSIVKFEELSSPFSWKGYFSGTELKVEIKLISAARYGSELLINSSAPEHLDSYVPERGTLLSLANASRFETEESFYESIDWQYVQPELREGTFEVALAASKNLPQLIETTDLKGCLHNHSTWSDGQHSIEEMSLKCIEHGYEYFGISDHSQTAAYAHGLQEFRVFEQHKEIDEVNKKLAPFRVFKGIESDILQDGSLDYPEHVLRSFDFIVASVHSTLNMDITKATDRLLTAIHNPYTTILGHPTGRLLLKREGYPLDFKEIINACAKNNVVIEINASPWRLDLDWRWVHYACEQGVWISINPDAHETAGIADMYYGVGVARKGGLTRKNCFNALSATEVAAFFDNRKKKIAGN